MISWSSACARWIIFYLARSSTRATDKRHFLQPLFYIQALIYNIHYVTYFIYSILFLLLLYEWHNNMCLLLYAYKNVWFTGWNSSQYIFHRPTTKLVAVCTQSTGRTIAPSIIITCFWILYIWRWQTCNRR